MNKRRRIPSLAWLGWAIFLLVTAFIGFGFWVAFLMATMWFQGAVWTGVAAAEGKLQDLVGEIDENRHFNQQ